MRSLLLALLASLLVACGGGGDDDDDGDDPPPPPPSEPASAPGKRPQPLPPWCEGPVERADGPPDYCGK